MPPPDKKTGKGKTLLQSYLNTFNQQSEDPTTVISGNIQVISLIEI